jgi:hypothetical protein
VGRLFLPSEDLVEGAVGGERVHEEVAALAAGEAQQADDVGVGQVGQHLELLFKLADLLGVGENLDSKAGAEGLINATVHPTKGTLSQKAVGVEAEAGLGEVAVLELDGRVLAVLEGGAEGLAGSGKISGRWGGGLWLWWKRRLLLLARGRWAWVVVVVGPVDLDGGEDGRLFIDVLIVTHTIVELED